MKNTKEKVLSVIEKRLCGASPDECFDELLNRGGLDVGVPLGASETLHMLGERPNHQKYSKKLYNIVVNRRQFILTILPFMRLLVPEASQEALVLKALQVFLDVLLVLSKMQYIEMDDLCYETAGVLDQKCELNAWLTPMEIAHKMRETHVDGHEFTEEAISKALDTLRKIRSVQHNPQAGTWHLEEERSFDISDWD